jgi:hypothetical protein
MKITIRLIVSLVIVVALVALAFSLYEVNTGAFSHGTSNEGL